jgi:hypothetical protein
MSDLPAELEPHRDAIYDRVRAGGRAARRRRFAKLAGASAIALLVPVAVVVAVVSSDDDSSDVAVQPTTSTTTTVPVCRNSTNPACGPFFYDPPLTNEPAAILVSTSPAVPKVGDTVIFTLEVTDPDTDISNPCMTFNFGEGVSSNCEPDCSTQGPRYGAWDPPPIEPDAVTYEMPHVYTAAGTYEAHFDLTVGTCGPRPTRVATTVPMEIAP